MKDQQSTRLDRNGNRVAEVDLGLRRHKKTIPVKTLQLLWDEICHGNTLVDQPVAHYVAAAHFTVFFNRSFLM